MDHSHSTVSLPIKLIDKVDELIEDLGFWPSRSAFVREAVLEKLKKEKNENKDWLPDNQ